MLSWGSNSHGQLGQGTVTEQIENPTKVTIDPLYFNQIKQISCGGGHTLLIDNEGKMYSCGWNSKHQSGTNEETHSFVRVWELSGITFTNIACGWDFSCAVTDSNFLFVWGSNRNGQLGLPRDHFPDIIKPFRLPIIACSVSMGLRHTAIINSKGEVWTTGCGRHGQLGLGNDKLSLDKFEQVTKLGTISHIACGQNYTVTWCSEEKALYVWGDNKHGQLLLSTDKYKKIFTPQKIDIGVKHGVKKLLSGWTNVLLWLDNGTLCTWGRNNYGQLGTEEPFIGKIIHVKLPDNRQVKDVALGSEHTICLASDNTLWAWGWNEHANTGTNSKNNVFVPTLVPIDGTNKITGIFAGGAHNFVTLELDSNSDNTENNNNTVSIN
ncbi:uncharacterized protein LOC113516906 [Galleria mellonella]|uniref:Uncharacterized protein LOC113516906 n=1 Tax=Galleria mellonella TaxID=7137 RepID=A0A6J1WWE8_GALME|nr:uncharacterized protein LOC113516906 [Galleria mellonella]